MSENGEGKGCFKCASPPERPRCAKRHNAFVWLPRQTKVRLRGGSKKCIATKRDRSTPLRVTQGDAEDFVEFLCKSFRERRSNYVSRMRIGRSQARYSVAALLTRTPVPTKKTEPRRFFETTGQKTFQAKNKMFFV